MPAATHSAIPAATLATTPATTPVATLSATLAATIVAFVARHPPAERVLVVVDQLEELFTLASAAERHRFITMLRVLRSVPQCYLLLGLRADFYGALMDKMLDTLPAEQVLSHCAPEQRLAGLPPEQRLAGLPPRAAPRGTGPRSPGACVAC